MNEDRRDTRQQHQQQQHQQHADDRRDTRQNQNAEDIAVIKNKLESLEESVEKLVSKVEFAPVKLIVYSLTGMILSSAFAAIISLVLVR